MLQINIKINYKLTGEYGAFNHVYRCRLNMYDRTIGFNAHDPRLWYFTMGTIFYITNLPKDSVIIFNDFCILRLQ